MTEHQLLLLTVLQLHALGRPPKSPQPTALTGPPPATAQQQASPAPASALRVLKGSPPAAAALQAHGHLWRVAADEVSAKQLESKAELWQGCG
jgi:hypothetical protein